MASQLYRLKVTFSYLDDVTVCGQNQQEQKRNLERFLNAVKKYNLTLNPDNYYDSTKCLVVDRTDKFYRARKHKKETIVSVIY